MYKTILQGIENIEVWPVIAMILFFTVFAFGVIYAVTADKKFIDHMENLPLDQEEDNVTNRLY